MSLLGAFTGGNAARTARQTRDANTGFLAEGYNEAGDFYNQGRAQANARLNPYAQAGQRGQQAYMNLLGLNGTGAQNTARGAYNNWNPYLGDQMTAATGALDRRAAATGQFNGGMNALAKQRAVTDMGSRDFYAYNDRLQGLGQQGMQAAGMQGANDMQWGNNRAGLSQWRAQGNINNQTQYGNAKAQADQAGVNNFLKIGGMALGALGGPLGGMIGGGLGALGGAIGGLGSQSVFSQMGSPATGGWSTEAFTPSIWQRGANYFG